MFCTLILLRKSLKNNFEWCIRIYKITNSDSGYVTDMCFCSVCLKIFFIKLVNFNLFSKTLYWWACKKKIIHTKLVSYGIKIKKTFLYKFTRYFPVSVDLLCFNYQTHVGLFTWSSVVILNYVLARISCILEYFWEIYLASLWHFYLIVCPWTVNLFFPMSDI